MQVKVYAKINLSLNIVGSKNNMHLMDSVVASVDLCDAISISPRLDSIINVEIDDNSIDKKLNSVTKAIDAIKKRISFNSGFDIIIRKGIPIGGGLGGSSADAAGVIVGLDNILRLSASGINLNAIAMETGSDTLFMLRGGFACMRETGSALQPFECDTVLNLVLAHSNHPSLTKNVFEGFDRIYPSGKHSPSDNASLIAKLKSGDLHSLSTHLDNALYEAAIKTCPSIQETKNAFKKTQALTSFMTGSGSVVVGLFENAESAKEGAIILKNEGLYAAFAPTRKRGIIIE